MTACHIVVRWLWLAIVWRETLPVVIDGTQQKFARQPVNITARIGDTVVLPCQVEHAAGAVQWTRDEFALGVDRALPEWPRMKMVGDEAAGFCSLQIVNVGLGDDGVYQCQAGATELQAGIRSRNAWLTVLSPPDPLVLDQGAEITVTAGSPTRLSCTSRGGRPAPQLHWSTSVGASFMNDAKIFNEKRLMDDMKRYIVQTHLEFTPTAKHHNITVTCSNVNHAHADKSQAAHTHLHVHYPPQVTIVPAAARVTEYEPAEFYCSAKANPAGNLNYSWRVNGETVGGGGDGGGGGGKRLRLHSVGRQLNGARVTCHVEGAVGVGATAAHLQVLYGARLLANLSDISGDQNENVTLTCQVEGNPAPDIRWLKYDCATCRKMVGVGRSLTVTVTSATVGLYQCRASTPGFPTVATQSRVMLRSAPQVYALSPQTVKIGSRGFVECHVQGTPAPTSTNWYMYGQQLAKDNAHFSIVNMPVNGGVTSHLVIDPVTRRDLGVYNCSFGNSYGWHSAVVVLQTQSSTSFTILCASIVLGLIMLASAFLLWFVMRHRFNRTAPSQPQDSKGGMNGNSASSTNHVLKQDNLALSLITCGAEHARSASISPGIPNNLQLKPCHYNSNYFETISSQPTTYSPILTDVGGSLVLPSFTNFPQLQQRHLFTGSYSAMYRNPALKCPTTLSRMPPPPSYRSSIHLATHV